jgi:hypothetical protein
MIIAANESPKAETGKAENEPRMNPASRFALCRTGTDSILPHMSRRNWRRRKKAQKAQKT